MLSVDETPSIQALERTRGYVQASSGKIVQGMKITCKRHGTVNLFAALEVATGIIRGKTTQTQKRADFQAFMDEVFQDPPAGRQIHVILDNLNIHETLNNASFKSIAPLRKAFHDFTAAYNENAVPFAWRKREIKGSFATRSLTCAIRH